MSTIYVENNVKMRKTGMSAMKTVAEAYLKEIMETCVLEESKAVEAATVVVDERNRMKKVFNVVVVFCSIYYTDSGNLVEKHRLAIREGLTEKLDFVLAKLPSYVQRDHTDSMRHMINLA